MRALGAVIALVAIATAGCKKTDDGIEATTPTIDIDIGSRKDTINLPTVTTQKETLIINKPVDRLE